MTDEIISDVIGNDLSNEVRKYTHDINNYISGNRTYPISPINGGVIETLEERKSKILSTY